MGSLLAAECSSCGYAEERLMRHTGFAGVFYELKNCRSCQRTVSVAVESLDVGGPFAEDAPELNTCPHCGGRDVKDLRIEGGSIHEGCPRCGGDLEFEMVGIWD